MGKNEHGGNKQKSKKNNQGRQKSVPISQIMPDNKTKFVAKVIGSVGNRLNIEILPTNTPGVVAIPGSFRNRIWIKTHDYVLIEICQELAGYNSFILHKYDGDEIDELIELNILSVKKSNDDDSEEESNFIFTDGKDKDTQKEEHDFFKEI